jgi:hypothetical protein
LRVERFWDDIQGLRCMIWIFGIKVVGSGCGVQGLGFLIKGLGLGFKVGIQRFWVKSLGFQVWGYK